jgi:hypothetical protein
MREVFTTAPSFPNVVPNEALKLAAGERWQVACGDADHWRCGFYSPEVGSASEIKELEWHDCPEMFMLLSGRVSLLLADEQGERVLELEPLKPVLVSCRHAGFCPDGPHSGQCIVIERDTFRTEYTER